MSQIELNLSRLKECREKMGLSKQKSAKLIGVTQPAYVRYESGERTPSIQVVKEIAKVFNTSPDYLLGLTDSPEVDYYVVEKKTDPELFALVEKYNKNKLTDAERFIEYFKKML